MNTMQLLTGPVAQAIGWALLHLLWQAGIIAGILAATLALMSRSSARARYAVSCAALALVFALFVGTAYRAYDPSVAPVRPAAATPAPEEEKISLAQVPVIIAAVATESWRERLMSFVMTARQSLPSVVAIWLLGVVVLSSRLLVSWIRARRLATHGSVDASAQWQAAAARLSDALGLKRAVRLLESAAVEVPSVIGSLKPVILLPASTLTGLTPAQIEMILAHELAHIRRHDFLVNLLQAVVETLMFYHPAVWWMSRRVRIERENCCDDLAVAVCGNPIQYARALTRLEELRSASMTVVVAANGGSLLDRVRRIATTRAESTGVSSRWAAAVFALTIVAVALALPSLPVFADKEEKPAKAEKAKPAQASVEVVEPAHAAAAAKADAEAAEGEAAEAETEIYTPEPPEAEDDEDEPIVVAVTPAPMAYAVAPPAPTPVVAPAPRPAATPAPPVAVAWMMDDQERDRSRERSSRKFGSGGKLTVEELIQLRSAGVTPKYIDEMRQLFPDLTLGDVVSARHMGVTAEYIREMRGAGFPVTSIREATNLRAAGVNAQYIADMKAAGVKFETARDIQSLRSMGVTVKFVKQLADAGYTNLSVRELTRLAAAGVDGDFIREMQKYRDKN